MFHGLRMSLSHANIVIDRLEHNSRNNPLDQWPGWHAYIMSKPSATRAGDLMQDLKTGALLKASPRSQFYGQMIGSLASVFVSAGAYKLYTRIYEVRSANGKMGSS